MEYLYNMRLVTISYICGSLETAYDTTVTFGFASTFESAGDAGGWVETSAVVERLPGDDGFNNNP